MGESLVLRIDDLRNALGRVLAQTEHVLGPEVTLEDDYYWHLPVEAAFDMSHEPDSLTVGQLTDDALSIRGGGGVPEEAWHDLSHLVGLLRALERRVRP